jgi:hypothetical protein
MTILKLKILFWKAIALVWDIRPRMHLPKYSDYPIASTDIIEGQEVYYPPEGVKVLFEWNEKGKHWIAFSR